MGDINELRQRVEAAEERFGLIKEEQSKYSQRLIELIARLENSLHTLRSKTESGEEEIARLNSQNAELRSKTESNEEEIARVNFQNEELRSMLHSLLLSIESDNFDSTLRSLDTRIAAMIQSPAEPGDVGENEGTLDAGDMSGEATEDSIEEPEEVAPSDAEAEPLTAESSDFDAEPAPEEAEIDIPNIASTAMEDTEFGEEGGAIDEDMHLAAAGDTEIELLDESGEEPATTPDLDGAVELDAAAFPLEEAVVEMAAQAQEPEAEVPQEQAAEEHAASVMADPEQEEALELDSEPVDSMAAAAPAIEALLGEDQASRGILLDAPAAPDDKEEEPSVKDIIKRVSALVRDLAEDDAPKQEIAAETDSDTASSVEEPEIPAKMAAAGESEGEDGILDLIDEVEEEQASLAAS